MRKKKISLRHIVLATMNLNLLLFLIEKGALTAFLDNCIVKDIYYVEIIEWTVEKFNDATLERQKLGIEGYFSWARSPEGYNYWNNLYHDFRTNFPNEYT